MNKKAKHIISILLAVILSTLCNISTIFAQNPTISINSLEVNNDAETSKMLSLEEYNIKFNHEEYNHKELSSRAARLSGVKTKTKNIITSINNMTVGTVTIKHQSYMESGRPKFALDTVSISAPPSRYGIWLLTDSYVSYSTDHISVHYTYETTVGDMTDYATVNSVQEA